jgi:group I intron endonuclease
MGYIYLVTNRINGMKYVGQTLCNDINTRWRNHRKVAKSALGRYLYSAYIKYGIENFKFQIICICFDKDCNKYEEEYITKFNTLAPNGYNLRVGGKNSKMCEESKLLHKQRIKEAMTAEIRTRIAAKLKGRNISEEQKVLLRKKQTAYWANLSEEKRKEISNKRKLNYKTKGISDKQYNGLKIGQQLSKGKRVGKYDNNDNLLEEFTSVCEASQKSNICRVTISKVCLQKPKYHTAGGFVWKFI